MSQSPTPDRQNKSTSETSVSQQAVASVLCAAILCCPLTSLVGLIMGLRSMRAIQRSEGRLGGARLALLGVLLSCFGLFSQLFVLGEASQYVQRNLETGARKAVRGLFESPRTNLLEVWSSDVVHNVLLSDVDAFRQTAVERYGAFRNVLIQSPINAVDDAMMRFRVPVVFHFEGASQTGAVAFDVRPEGLNPYGRVRLRSVILTDPDKGDLQLPPERSEPQEGAAGENTTTTIP